MTSALVIGYGNELRGDDGIGPHLARAVAERGWPGVQALAVHQLTPELAEAIADAELVVFVDARCGKGAEAVAVRRIEAAGSGSTGHRSDPSALLALSHELFGGTPAVWLVTVCGAAFEHGNELSAAALAACPRALERIAALVEAQSPMPLSKSAATARR